MDYGYIGSADGPTAIMISEGTGAWNPINWFGVITVLLILLPNIVYAVKYKGEKNLCANRLLNVCEQIGRFGSMLCLMVYVGPKGEFGFSSVFALLVYLFGNSCLILAYWIVWGVYFKAMGGEQTRKVIGLKYALAVLPAMIFLLDSLCLRHYLLGIFAVIFAIAHIGVTRENIKGKGSLR